MSENPSTEPTPETEKLRRERELLLRPFDPSDFGFRPNAGVFTEPAPGSRLTDDLGRGFEPEEPTE